MLFSSVPGSEATARRSEARRRQIAAQATGPGREPVHIDYQPHEDATWARVQAELGPLTETHVCEPLRAARRRLRLPTDRVPQLAEVSDRLRSSTGWVYASVPGTVPGHEFFAALADRTFSSTQFIRSQADLAYTPAPDVIHEVGGHAISLADPLLAELHHLAGRAAVAAPDRLSEIASVFWFSIEFGVVRDPARPGRWQAYGTGLLSSPGELAWFADNAQVRPLDPAAMATTPYELDRYQPILFGARSLDHVHDVVGGWFAALADASSPVAHSPTHSSRSRTCPI